MSKAPSTSPDVSDKIGFLLEMEQLIQAKLDETAGLPELQAEYRGVLKIITAFKDEPSALTAGLMNQIREGVEYLMDRVNIIGGKQPDENWQPEAAA